MSCKFLGKRWCQRVTLQPMFWHFYESYQTICHKMCIYIYIIILYYIIFYSIILYSILFYSIIFYYIILYYIILYLCIYFLKSIYIYLKKSPKFHPSKFMNSPHSSTSLLRVSPCFASKITPFRWHLPAPALSLPPALQTPVPAARRAPPKQRKRHRGGNRPGAARGQRRGG